MAIYKCDEVKNYSDEKSRASDRLTKELEDKYGDDFIQYYMNLSASRRHMKKRRLKLNYLPRWFRSDKYGFRIPVDYPLGDHIRWDSKRKTLELHPYHTDMGQLKELINYCEKNDLNFSVHGTSDYFYGNSFMVRIYKKSKG